MDVPSHFIAGGRTVDQVSLASAMGPCRVVEFSGPAGSSIPPEIMFRNQAQRILFKTFNSTLLAKSEFDRRFVSLSEELARILAANDMKLVGIDYFSVDRFDSPDHAIHQILLGSGVLILEGLNLSEVEPGEYELVALPLNLAGAEGSPVRAVLVK